MANYACTDFHGMYSLWEQIKNFCKADDHIYFLGDAIDYGPDGVDIMLELIDDPRVVYLMGDHEKMMLDALKGGVDSPSFKIWMDNGGKPTYESFCLLAPYARKKIMNQLRHMQLYTYLIFTDDEMSVNIFLSHSGSLRDPLYGTDKDLYGDVQEENLYIIHGHTPTYNLAKKIDGQLQYMYFDDDREHDKVMLYGNNYQKIDLDLYSYKSGTAALIDLLTFEGRYFFDSELMLV